MEPRPAARRGLVIVGIVAAWVVVLAAVAGAGWAGYRWLTGLGPETAEAGDEPCDPSDDAGDTRSLCLYPERADREPDDHEARLGDGVRLAGYTATVEEVFVHELVLDDQLALRVRIENRDDRPQRYAALDWKVETAPGVLETPGRNERDDALGRGELDPGEVVEGTIVYDLPAGEYYVHYRPDVLNAARGVWYVDL